jgi:CDP-glycerol glycerophosphotransferase
VGRLRARHGTYDAVVAADYFSWDSHGAPKVQIFHGCSFKNVAIHEKALQWDHLFTIGPYMRRQFVAAGLCAADDPRLHLVGMPKLDRLARADPGGAGRRQVLEAHDLDPERPCLLYAPTCHEHESSLGSFGPDLVGALLAAGEHSLLIKLHDHSLDRRYNERDWGAWLETVTRHPAAAAFRGRDVTRALQAADLLVSDASSVAYEYAVRDRPIVFLETDVQRERMDLATFGRSIGHVARDVGGALAAIAGALANPGELADRRQALVRELFHEPGYATDHAVTALQEILGLAPGSLTPGPAIN